MRVVLSPKKKRTRRSLRKPSVTSTCVTTRIWSPNLAWRLYSIWWERTTHSPKASSRLAMRCCQWAPAMSCTHCRYCTLFTCWSSSKWWRSTIRVCSKLFIAAIFWVVGWLQRPCSNFSPSQRTYCVVGGRQCHLKRLGLGFGLLFLLVQRSLSLFLWHRSANQ